MAATTIHALAADPGAWSRIKRALAGLLAMPAINRPVRLAVRPFAPLLPLEWLSRLPLVGRARVRLRPGIEFALESDGRDIIASAVDWRGLQGWEPETFGLLPRVLPVVGTCFDVGASTGLFSLAMATDDRSRRVFAFEASPSMAARLKRNIALNGAANVTVIEAAACAHDGAIDLFVPPGHSLPFGASTLESFRRPGERVRVPAVRLDSVAAAHDVARVDLIKIDTEGTEPHVLEGARMLLARDEPLILCEVLYGLTEPGLHAALDQLDYRPYAITSVGLEPRERIVGDPTYRDRNWLFATPRRLVMLGLA